VLLASSSLMVGLNALALEVKTSAGAPVTDATLEFRPRFTAAGGSRRCPVIGPAAAGADGRHAFHAVFQEPSGAGTWTAEVAVTRGGTTTTVPLSTLTVAKGKDLARTFASGASEYVLAIEFLAAPEVGLNPVAVTLHETQDQGMTFAPVADATFTLDPQMPSMGHGSPGSVDPTPVSPGWYEGKVSFSMTGPWIVTVDASRSGASIGSPAFDVAF
jgi:hypothetical protein